MSKSLFPPTCAGPASRAILLLETPAALAPPANKSDKGWIMANAGANGIQIEYETTGDPGNRPLLLIIGLADQLIHWDDGLCADLAARGHYVIRFDNRDSGLSTKCDRACTRTRRGTKDSPFLQP